MLTVSVVKKLGNFDLNAMFSAPKGVTVLFGKSGAGKSTLAHMIAGLIKPDQGRITAEGTTLFDSASGVNLPVPDRRVGYVFQDSRLFPHMSVQKNLEFGRRLTRHQGSSSASLEEIVDLLGIESLLGRRPAKLSGGERQRVAIGRALLCNPQLLIMDEPLASLDNERRSEILPYIETLRQKAGMPIIYISHAMQEVLRLADNMVLIENGTVIASGPATEVFAQADLQSPVADRLTGAVINATIVDHDTAYGLTRLNIGTGEIVIPIIHLLPGTGLRLQIDARDVAISLAPVQGISIRNQIEARITEITQEEGPYARLHLDACGQTLYARVTRFACDELALSTGRNVIVMIKSVAIDSNHLGALKIDNGKADHDLQDL